MIDFQGNSAIFVGTIICVESIHKTCDIFLLKDIVVYPLSGYNGFIEKRMLEIKFFFYMNKKLHKTNSSCNQICPEQEWNWIGWQVANQVPCFIGYQT